MPSPGCPPSGTDGGGEVGQYGGGGVEVHARVGDALPVGERLRRAGLLAALDQKALQHHASQAVLARRLLRDGFRHHRLAAVVLAAVAVVASALASTGFWPCPPRPVDLAGFRTGQGRADPSPRSDPATDRRLAAGASAPGLLVLLPRTAG